MTEEELYEVNGGWGRKKEKADKPKKEKIKKEKHIKAGGRIHAGFDGIDVEGVYEKDETTSIEKTNDSAEQNFPEPKELDLTNARYVC